MRLPTIVGKLADISSVFRFEKYHCTCTQHVNVKATYYVFDSLIKKQNNDRSKWPQNLHTKPVTKFNKKKEH